MTRKPSIREFKQRGLRLPSWTIDRSRRTLASLTTITDLDLLARRSLDRIASAAAALVDAPLVLISVIDGSHQMYVGSFGLSEMRAHEPSPLCREVAMASRPIVLQDATRRLPVDARGVWGFELGAYAGVALNLLLTPSRAGALACLSPVRRAWQSNDLHVLRCLADAAASVLDMRSACR